MFRRLIRNKTILAIASIIFGIYLIVRKAAAIDMIIRVLGYGLLAVGVLYLLSYFVNRQRKDEVQLGYGAAAAVAGLLVIWLAPAIRNLFPILAGAVLVISGLTNLLQVTGDKAYGREYGILPILQIILGAVIIFNPGFIAGTIIVVIGAAFVFNGLSDLNIIRKVW